MIKNGELSDIAKTAIAGFMELAPSLTAFGNMNPTSYFRLVPHQEAPTNICWGDRNRSVLVRVPLGWTKPVNMISDANPQEKGDTIDFSGKQTVELRSPDGSADIYLLLAGMTVAARHGFEMKDALKVAEKTYVDINIFDKEHQTKQNSLAHLPSSCVESAGNLLEQKAIYLEKGVFPEAVLNQLVNQLKAFNDTHLREEIENDNDKILDLVTKYFHCG
jgi:glutamine synthetase